MAGASYQPAHPTAGYDAQGFCLKHPMIRMCRPPKKKSLPASSNSYDTESTTDLSAETNVVTPCPMCNEGAAARRQRRRQERPSEEFTMPMKGPNYDSDYSNGRRRGRSPGARHDDHVASRDKSRSRRSPSRSCSPGDGEADERNNHKSSSWRSRRQKRRSPEGNLTKRRGRSTSADGNEAHDEDGGAGHRFVGAVRRAVRGKGRRRTVSPAEGLRPKSENNKPRSKSPGDRYGTRRSSAEGHRSRSNSAGRSGGDHAREESRRASSRSRSPNDRKETHRSRSASAGRGDKQAVETRASREANRSGSRTRTRENGISDKHRKSNSRERASTRRDESQGVSSSGRSRSRTPGRDGPSAPRYVATANDTGRNDSRGRYRDHSRPRAESRESATSRQSRDSRHMEELTKLCRTIRRDSRGRAARERSTSRSSRSTDFTSRRSRSRSASSAGLSSRRSRASSRDSSSSRLSRMSEDSGFKREVEQIGRELHGEMMKEMDRIQIEVPRSHPTNLKERADRAAERQERRRLLSKRSSSIRNGSRLNAGDQPTRGRESTAMGDVTRKASSGSGYCREREPSRNDGAGLLSSPPKDKLQAAPLGGIFSCRIGSPCVSTVSSVTMPAVATPAQNSQFTGIPPPPFSLNENNATSAPQPDFAGPPQPPANFKYVPIGKRTTLPDLPRTPEDCSPPVEQQYHARFSGQQPQWDAAANARQTSLPVPASNNTWYIPVDARQTSLPAEGYNGYSGHATPLGVVNEYAALQKRNAALQEENELLRKRMSMHGSQEDSAQSSRPSNQETETSARHSPVAPTIPSQESPLFSRHSGQKSNAAPSWYRRYDTDGSPRGSKTSGASDDRQGAQVSHTDIGGRNPTPADPLPASSRRRPSVARKTIYDILDKCESGEQKVERQAEVSSKRIERRSHATATRGRSRSVGIRDQRGRGASVDARPASSQRMAEDQRGQRERGSSHDDANNRRGCSFREEKSSFSGAAKSKENGDKATATPRKGEDKGASYDWGATCASVHDLVMNRLYKIDKKDDAPNSTNANREDEQPKRSSGVTSDEDSPHSIKHVRKVSTGRPIADMEDDGNDDTTYSSDLTKKRGEDKLSSSFRSGGSIAAEINALVASTSRLGRKAAQSNSMSNVTIAQRSMPNVAIAQNIRQRPPTTSSMADIRGKSASGTALSNSIAIEDESSLMSSIYTSAFREGRSLQSIGSGASVVSGLNSEGDSYV